MRWFFRAVGMVVLGVVVWLAFVASPALSTARAEQPVPELTPNDGWLNSDTPLRFSDELKGHVVILDFWTHCCINCMHIFPDLDYLEEKYKNDPVVVIGVHSAKFSSEGERRSVRNAVERYAIKHPVVIDRGMAIWSKFGVNSWPTFVVIDTRGRFFGVTSGEGNRTVLDRAVEKLLQQGKDDGTLAPKRLTLAPGKSVGSLSGLSFPGKVIAHPPDEAHPKGWLFVADSSHHRVLAATYPDGEARATVVRVFGTGRPEFTDGPSGEASFHEPQGLAFDPLTSRLFVADRKNHAVRIIDLVKNDVTTLAGNGLQSYDRWGGRAGLKQGLSSPWDLVLTPDRARLIVAMAGTHQLWQINVANATAEKLAGSGRETLADGGPDESALAQPSGVALSGDARTLYVADSETSAVRALDLTTNATSTILGEGLFVFGDADGTPPKARLQHCLGVATLPAGTLPGVDREVILVADTYNSKLKTLDPANKTLTTWVGSPEGGSAPDAVVLDEPGGVSVARSGRATTVFVPDTNNHRIVMIDASTKRGREVTLDGLAPTGTIETPKDARVVEAAAAGDRPVTLEITPKLPAGTHMNPEAPATVRISREGREVLMRTLRTDDRTLRVELPSGLTPGEWLVEVSYASCTDADRGLCIPGSAAWVVRVAAGQATIIPLTHE